LLFATALSACAASGRVVKVLPHLLDLRGRHTVFPSLYDRDAYQAYLRQNTNKISGVRFNVEWKTRGVEDRMLKLRIEVRGMPAFGKPTLTVLEKEVAPAGRLGRWTSLPLTGDDYRNIGEVTAWRATLWDGDKLLGEQKSFLW